MQDIESLTIERDEIRILLNKFVKLDPKRTDRMCVRNATKAVRRYCRNKFDGIPYPELNHRQAPYYFNMVEHFDGKNICLFVKGFEVYKGSIKYLERWYKVDQLRYVNQCKLESRTNKK
jgi:hypothetical protein